MESTPTKNKVLVTTAESIGAAATHHGPPIDDASDARGTDRGRQKRRGEDNLGGIFCLLGVSSVLPVMR